MTTSALLYVLPIAVWSIVAADAWSFRWQYRPRSGLYRLLPILTTTMVLMYLLHLIAALFLPTASAVRAPRWFDLTDVTTMAAVAQFRHLACYFRLDASPPSSRWLALTYGSAGLVAAINIFPEVIPAASIERQIGIARGVIMPYVIGNLYLALRELRGFARPGGWRPGSMVARYADLTVLALGIGLAALLYLWFATVIGPGSRAGFVQPPAWMNASVGLLFAVPFAARMVGHMVKRLAKVFAVLLAAAATHAATQTLSVSVDRGEVASLLTIGCWSALVLIFTNQSWLDAIIDRLLLRRGHSRRVALENVMLSLSPEIGALACCQRVVDELVGILRLRGVVILLSPGTKVALAGTIRVEPLLRVWDDGHGIDRLPARPFSLASFRELAPSLQEALVEAEVVGMLPIVSPRRRWGAAFATASPISASMGTADRQEMQSLASHLARILDATELIDRVVTVERSLAPADKLAAIGETAARIAHDIRNPVTAARSLAQQLVRESSASDAEATSLILAELERVENHVASLLRFARRDEYRFAAVDIGALVRATIDSVRGRAAASRVSVDTQIAEDVTARVDAEKMRQVLLNLVDNALDALANGSGQPRLQVSVSRANAHAHVTVADNGPGAPADALPHLFEPFFSLKEKGTGLGLAIVKRTVEAHDGRIVVSPTHPGIAFDIELPLAAKGTECEERS